MPPTPKQWHRAAPTSNIRMCVVGASAALPPKNDEQSCEIYVLSADHGVAWNPFMRRHPRARPEWIFATPTTPRFVAHRSTPSGGKVSVLHSESHNAQPALEEMAAEIIAEDPEGAIVLSTGGTLIQCAAAITARLEALFGLKPSRIAVVVVPNAKPAAPEFECVEDHFLHGGDGSRARAWFLRSAKEHASLPLRERLSIELCKMWANGGEVAAKIIDAATRECAFEELFEQANHGELANADKREPHLAVDLDYAVIILVGCVGGMLHREAQKVAAQLATLSPTENKVHIVSEREAARLRAHIGSTRQDLIAKLEAGVRLVVAAPNPRCSDREIFARLAHEAAISSVDEHRRVLVAWITKPGYWENMQNSESPASSLEFYANSMQFEPPDMDPSIPFIRLV